MAPNLVPPVGTANPWRYDSGGDYMDRRLTISIPWDPATGNIVTPVTITRDEGCIYERIVLDDPSNVAKKKPLPRVPEGTTSLTWQQVNSSIGLRSIDEVLAVQITAEP